MQEGHYWLLSAIIIICVPIWIWLVSESLKFKEKLVSILQSKDKEGKSSGTLIKILKFLLTSEKAFKGLNFFIFITLISSMIGLFLENSFFVGLAITFSSIVIVWMLLYFRFIIKINWGCL